MENKMQSISAFGKMYEQNAGYGNLESRGYAMYPKLHGTNASLVFSGETMEVRSKNRILELTDDHFGFTLWAKSEKTALAHVRADFLSKYGLNNTEDTILWGEWAGQGVQNGHDMVCKLPEKYFFIFAIQHGDRMFTDLAGIYPVISRCKVLRPYFWVDIGFSVRHSIKPVLDQINRKMEELEVRDEYIANNFPHIEVGPGEGMVGVQFGILPVDRYFQTAFKCKTEAHAVKKQKTPTDKWVLPEDVASFVSSMVTDARLNQAVHETGSALVMQDTGPVMKWMCEDIAKEGAEELIAMQCEFKKVQKSINQATLEMWKDKVNGRE